MSNNKDATPSFMSFDKKPKQESEKPSGSGPDSKFKIDFPTSTSVKNKFSSSGAVSY